MRAVFLDRDGVLNANVERDGRPVAPERLEDFRLLPDVPEAVRKLKRAGFVVIVVTNQPDVANGRTERAVVDAMHAELRRRMPIDDIKVCYHNDADDCRCRKPRPGLLLEAANEKHLDLTNSYMIGDRWRDIEAGRAAGCVTVGVDFRESASVPPDFTVSNLSEAVTHILRRIGGAA